MPGWKTWTLLALGAGGVVAGATVLRREPPAAGATATTVRVVRRDVGTQVRATGIVKPRTGAEVRVGSQISGVVRRLFVRIGDRVRRGDALAELDDRDLAARRAEAAANEAAARADLAYARAELRRRRELAAARVVAASDLDAAERAAARAEEQLHQASAALVSATTQLGYARIAAPIDGVVASISTQEGETVAAAFAAPTFVTLLDLERLEVRAYVDETDIGRVAVGQPATFTVDTYGDQEFAGTVAAIYPQAEIRDNVVNYVTVVTFAAPPDRVLRPEMTATVRVALDAKRGVLALPLGALRRDGGETYVLLPDDGAAPQRRTVTTGARDESGVEIVAGLGEGDAVLLGDPSTVRGD